MAKVRTVPIEDAPAAAGMRPVVTLVPLGPALKVDAVDPDAPGTGSRVFTGVKAAMGAAGIAHLAMAAPLVKEASSVPEIVWDTIGLSKRKTIVKTLLVPFAGPKSYKSSVKPLIDEGQLAVDHLGG
jgi:hypothetical protein